MQTQEEKEAILERLGLMDEEMDTIEEEPDFPLSMLCLLEQLDAMQTQTSSSQGKNSENSQKPATYPHILQDL